MSKRKGQDAVEGAGHVGGAAQALLGHAAELAKAFEAGARAERARALEQARVSLFNWQVGSDSRRSLELYRKELADERLPLPAYTWEGA